MKGYYLIILGIMAVFYGLIEIITMNMLPITLTLIYME